MTHIKKSTCDTIRNLNLYFFGDTHISTHDAVWFYGGLGFATVTLVISVVAKLFLI